MSFKVLRSGQPRKSEEPSEEFLLKTSSSDPSRRSLDSIEDDQDYRTNLLPTSTHRRHGLRFKPQPKKSIRSLAIVCLIVLSFVFLVAVFLLLNPDFNAGHPSRPIKWTRPPPTVRRWSNFYGLLRPEIGSPEWKRSYPPSRPAGPKPLKNWIRRYDYLRTISSSKQPDSPLSTTWTNPQAQLSMKNGLAEYPDGTVFNSDPNGICSYRRASCLRGQREDRGIGLQDLWFGKNHTWSINFDDGPLPPSTSLYKFLDEHQETATHFWVGANVRDYPDLALQAWKRGDHLAVHTWTHAHLTTLTDHEILGELGWTIQIIYDLTGLVPLYYRPPYGDVDNRVRALAKHVFGLTTTLWNCDSSDWSLNQTYALGDFLDPPMNGFGVKESVHMINQHINQADKAVGNVILEHELSFESVEAFKLTFPNLKKNSWITCNLADCLGLKWYQ